MGVISAWAERMEPAVVVLPKENSPSRTSRVSWASSVGLRKVQFRVVALALYSAGMMRVTSRASLRSTPSAVSVSLE